MFLDEYDERGARKYPSIKLFYLKVAYVFAVISFDYSFYITGQSLSSYILQILYSCQYHSHVSTGISSLFQQGGKIIFEWLYYIIVITLNGTSVFSYRHCFSFSGTFLMWL